MLKNYLKTALRSLRRYPGYAFINITGLAVGLACCLLILLFVRDELGYDRFHEHSDRIYRIAVDSKTPSAPTSRYARSSRPIAPVLREEYPEVERAVRLYNMGSPGVKHENRWYYNDTVYFAESSFFDVFSFPLTAGDPATALEAPFTLVLTESAAAKYFGTTDALGKSLVLVDSVSFTVTGIVADPPRRSHLPFDIFISWPTFEQIRPTHDWEWTNFWMYTYVLLEEGASRQTFETKIANLVMRKFGDRLEQIGLDVRLVLEPLIDIYLHSDRQMQAGPTGDIRYVYLFTVIAVFVLLLASINFINLSTAGSLNRAREVGMRKVLGSSRATLIRQFMGEALLLVFAALLVAVALAKLVLPLLNEVAGKSLTMDDLRGLVSVMGMIGLGVIVGLLGGTYPALVLSRYRPADVLKGVVGSARHSLRLRQGLIVFQFAVSVVLIVGTLVVYLQLRYMQDQPLGFDAEQVIVVDASSFPEPRIPQRYETIKRVFAQHPAVTQVSASERVPGIGRGGGTMHPEGLPEGESRNMSYFGVDYDFVPTMGIKMIAGRDFSPAFQTDEQTAALINEAAVENIGWGNPAQAVGRTIRAGWDGTPLEVVGVFEDYHHRSLREQIAPLLLVVQPASFRYFSIRVDARDARSVLEHLEQTWRSVYPEHSFNYFFLDERFDRQYRSEERLATLFGIFTALAVLIACLGLFGLVAYTAQQRTKEIGIRKALGATVTGIVGLLSTDFLKLVGLAFVVAAPVAYVAMRRWLADFAYRIDLSVLPFLAAGGAALVIAMLSLSYHAVKAARADPAKALRAE